MVSDVNSHIWEFATEGIVKPRGFPAFLGYIWPIVWNLVHTAFYELTVLAACYFIFAYIIGWNVNKVLRGISSRPSYLSWPLLPIKKLSARMVIISPRRLLVQLASDCLHCFKFLAAQPARGSIKIENVGQINSLCIEIFLQEKLTESVPKGYFVLKWQNIAKSVKNQFEKSVEMTEKSSIIYIMKTIQDCFH